MFPYECYLPQEDPVEILLNEDSLSSQGSLKTVSDGGQSVLVSSRCTPSFRTQWILWRVVSGIMGIFFLLCAVVQHNDPDPYLWIPTYIIPCIVSWAVCLGLSIKKITRGKSHHRKGMEDLTVETEIMLPMYGPANHRLDWLINLHTLYCFGLGIWTLAFHVYNLRHYYGSLFYDNEELSLSDGVDASTEEAKELMGLCLVIAWLSLVRRNNYILLGKIGLTIGISLTILPIVAWILIEMYEGESKCGTKNM